MNINRTCIVSLLSLLALALPAAAQPETPAPKIIKKNAPVKEPAQQIEHSLQFFISSLNNRYFLNAQMYVVGARPGWFGANEWLRNWRRDIQLDAVQVDKLEGDLAQVTVTYRLAYLPHEYGANGEVLIGDDMLPRYKEPYTTLAARQAWFAKMTARRESLTLRYFAPVDPGEPGAVRPKVWGIVPGDFDAAMKLAADSLGRIAAIMQQPPGTVARVRADESMLRQKLLVSGVLQMIQDYDLTFLFAPECVEEAVRPYVASRATFDIPGTNLKYTFNGRLSGKPDKMADPARTVMFYEGDGEKPVARYNGLAAVGFCDGHAALLGPEEVKNLKWDP